jgi:hypothetical protein
MERSERFEWPESGPQPQPMCRRGIWRPRLAQRRTVAGGLHGDSSAVGVMAILAAGLLLPKLQTLRVNSILYASRLKVS